MIDHGKNGYLAKAFDVEDLSRGVHWVLEDVNRLLELSKNARTKVMERFTTVKIVNSYLELYEQILG
jgi:glycosyltransferase involved in cell wall biosynthesis